MWQRKRLLYLLLAGGGTGLMCGSLAVLTNCTDYLTGQIEEPSGPIQVTKLTLFDSSSRDQPVFTDTSIPDCSKNQNVDCTSPDNRDSVVCHTCYNDVNKDKFSPDNSVPTPDSGQDMRVVFNKVPLLLDGGDLGNQDLLNKAMDLTCAGCAGIPPLQHVLQISGSGVSFDPTQVPYGPSLQLTVDRTDPRSALEPGNTYQVTVNPGVAGRDGNKLDTAIAPALLTFQTEPFKVLRLGNGDAKNDKWVYATTNYGDGSPGKPYVVSDLVQNGVVALRFNASLYTAALKPITIRALINSGAATVDVKLGANNCKKGSSGYVQDDARTLYLIPATPDHSWPAIANEITASIPAAAIKDVAQKPGFPAGQHSVAQDLVVSIKLTGKPADSSFGGVLTTAAQAATDCADAMTMNPDMSTGNPDMGPAPDMPTPDMAM
jgi:hypothetical protein